MYGKEQWLEYGLWLVPSLILNRHCWSYLHHYLERYRICLCYSLGQHCLQCAPAETKYNIARISYVYVTSVLDSSTFINCSQEVMLSYGLVRRGYDCITTIWNWATWYVSIVVVMLVLWDFITSLICNAVVVLVEVNPISNGTVKKSYEIPNASLVCV